MKITPTPSVETEYILRKSTSSQWYFEKGLKSHGLIYSQWQHVADFLPSTSKHLNKHAYRLNCTRSQVFYLQRLNVTFKAEMHHQGSIMCLEAHFIISGLNNNFHSKLWQCFSLHYIALSVFALCSKQSQMEPIVTMCVVVG